MANKKQPAKSVLDCVDEIDNIRDDIRDLKEAIFLAAFGMAKLSGGEGYSHALLGFAKMAQAICDRAESVSLSLQEIA